MAKILDREATLKTMVVEIKALTVNGKQVTQAVFKQLEEEALIDDETLQLVGIPWGKVNYHVGCDPSIRENHLHIIWQLGDALRRCCVYKCEGQREAYWIEDRAKEMHRAGIVLLLRDHEPSIGGRPISQLRQMELKPEITVAGRRVRLNGTPYRLHHYWSEMRSGKRDNSQCDRYWNDFLLDLKPPPGWQGMDPEEALLKFAQLRERAKWYQSRWLELYESLDALDQLFIAV